MSKGAQQVGRKQLAFLAVCLSLAFSITALAKPKTMVFGATAERIFQAALKVAREHHTISYVDEKNLTFAFQTGMSPLSYGFSCNASVEPAGNGKAKLTLNVQKKKDLYTLGAGDRMAENFFKWVEQELVITTEETNTAPKERPAEENSSNLDPQVAVVTVTSTPEAAEIWVDEAFVGNTPSELRLGPGKHKVRISFEGHEDWTRELVVLPNSRVNLKATLKKRDPPSGS